jgi:anti-sigma regulatory factor (Ser/Thr protein kinase)
MEGSPEPRTWSRPLPAGPRTSGEARWFLWQALGDEDLVTDAEVAVLLTSELASNASRHGQEPIELSITIDEDNLKVSVFDHGPGFDPEDDATRAGGWGVDLLDRLATEWGVDRRDDGTEVWFQLSPGR